MNADNHTALDAAIAALGLEYKAEFGPQPAVTMAYRILAIDAAHAPMVPEWAALVADAQSIIAAHVRAAGV